MLQIISVIKTAISCTQKSFIILIPCVHLEQVAKLDDRKGCSVFVNFGVVEAVAVRVNDLAEFQNFL